MPESDSFWDSIVSGAGDALKYVTNTDDGGLLSDTGSFLGSAVKDDTGAFDFDKVAGVAGGIGNILTKTGVIDNDSYLGQLFGGTQPNMTGYQGEIPSYTASRMQVPGTYDPNRRPGSGGQRYFTDLRYDGGDTSGQATGLQALNMANLASTNRAGTPMVDVRAAEAARLAAAQQAAQAAAQNANNTQTLAQGGIIGLSMGGMPRMAQMMNQPRYLSGPMDGMADTIPASIDGKDPAALSGGEFVVPADIVSGLGNGNSDAGAKNLYAMMDKVRQARTGMKKQPPPINPNKMLPTARA